MLGWVFNFMEKAQKLLSRISRTLHRRASQHGNTSIFAGVVWNSILAHNTHWKRDATRQKKPCSIGFTKHLAARCTQRYPTNMATFCSCGQQQWQDADLTKSLRRVPPPTDPPTRRTPTPLHLHPDHHHHHDRERHTHIQTRTHTCFMRLLRIPPDACELCEDHHAWNCVSQVAW